MLAPFLPATAPAWSKTAIDLLATLLYIGISYNLSFMIFNLIPIPPLDGSRILYAFLPTKALLWFQKYERFFFYGILGLFLLSSFTSIDIIGSAVDAVMYLLFKIFFI